MTYNIKGMPWPIARGRERALERIASRLVEMRREGRQPHVVLLQEAFSSQAMALARQAGYRHAAFGPDADLRSVVAVRPADSAHLRQARWDRGERIGKSLGSGLVILSDYPVVRIDRMAFPDFACAGYDCLANKGVLIAHLDVPDAGPVSVVNTHLNARSAAGVPVIRSQQAYSRQAELMARFVARHVRRDAAVVLGGDMNIGSDRLRRNAFFAAFSQSGLAFVTPALGGAQQAGVRTDVHDRQELKHLMRRGKDWIFARDATGAPLRAVRAQVPFGAEADGEPLSDHFGYLIHYAAVSRRPHESMHFASRQPMPASGVSR